MDNDVIRTVVYDNHSRAALLVKGLRNKQKIQITSLALLRTTLACFLFWLGSRNVHMLKPVIQSPMISGRAISVTVIFSTVLQLLIIRGNAYVLVLRIICEIGI